MLLDVVVETERTSDQGTGWKGMRQTGTLRTGLIRNVSEPMACQALL